MSQPSSKMKAPPPEMQNWSTFLGTNSISNLNLTFFLTWFYWLTRLKKLAARAPARRYFCDENEKAYKRECQHIFLFCLVGAPLGGDSNLWFFVLGFLLEPSQRPLAGQTLIQNCNQLFRYRSTCIKKVSPKTKNLQMENQRFQFWRL